MEQEINKNYDEKFAEKSKDNIFRKAKITALDNQKRKDLDANECLKKKKAEKNYTFFFFFFFFFLRIRQEDV